MRMWQRVMADKRHILMPLAIGIIANVVRTPSSCSLGHQVVSTERRSATRASSS